METFIKAGKNKKSGVDEGVRTLDRRSHNPELYQLSYVHHNQDIPFGTYLSVITILNFAALATTVRTKPTPKWRARQDSNLRPPA